MTTTDSKPKLLSILIDYLSDKTPMEYPELEVSILQLDPLRITDDQKHYMEISSMFG